jgi:hypothetical protein
MGEYEQPRCPKCQSLDIHFEDLDKQVAYVGLFASIPIPYYKRCWKCDSCGQEWKEEEVVHESSTPMEDEDET